MERQILHDLLGYGKISLLQIVRILYSTQLTVDELFSTKARCILTQYMTNKFDKFRITMGSLLKGTQTTVEM